MYDEGYQRGSLPFCGRKRRKRKNDGSQANCQSVGLPLPLDAVLWAHRRFY